MKRVLKYRLMVLVCIVLCFSGCRKYDYSYLEEDIIETPEMTEPGLLVPDQTILFDATAEPQGILLKALGGEWTVEIDEACKDWVIETIPDKGSDGNTMLAVKVRNNNGMDEKEGFLTIKQPATNTSIQIKLKQFTHESKYTRLTDSLALVAMFKALNGESTESGWRNPWNLKKPMNEWTGVTLTPVRDEMRVTNLNVMDYSMNGELAMEIGNLRELTYLKMYGAKIARIVPSTISNLRKLETFDINFGANASLFVPESIGDMISLKYMNLGNLVIDMTSFDRLYSLETLETFICQTSLSGVLPEGISRWKNLKVLNISRSVVTTLPSDIGSMAKIEELILSNCTRLANLPSDISNLITLKKLDLITCSMLKSLPENIGNLSELTYIRINSCKNITEIPESFTKLKLAGELSFYGCEGLTYLPSGMDEMTGVTSLDLTNCLKLDRIPESVCNMAGLEKLTLNNCKGLTSFADNFGNLKSLKELSMSFSKIGSLPASFSGLTALEKISITGNVVTMTGEVEELFGGLTSIKEINVPGNAFTGSLLFLKNLNKLSIINLSKNNLDGAINFEELPTSLTSITLNDNKITGTIKGISRLINLTALTMTNNKLSGNIYAEIGLCTKLKSFYMADNDIEGTIPEEIINITPSTWAMVLKNNKLSGNIPASVLSSAKWKSWTPATNIYPQKAGYGFTNIP